MLLVFMIPTLGLCQNSGNNNLVSTTSQVGTFTYDIEVEGTPYLNDLYKMGKISFPEKADSYSLMRYDAYTDKIELIDTSQKVSALLKDKNIEVLLEGKVYRYIDYMEFGKITSGYANPLNEGVTTLYVKPRKVIGKVKVPEHGYENFKSPKFEDSSFYLLQKKGRAAEKVNLTKREIIYTINDKLSELKAFIKNEKLKVTSEAEVVHLLEYYNSLK